MRGFRRGMALGSTPAANHPVRVACDRCRSSTRESRTRPMTPHSRFLSGLVAVSVLALGACSNYLKRTDCAAALADLDRRVSANEAAIAALRTDLEARLDEHEVRLTQMAGRLHVDMNVHFAFDAA